MEYTIDIDHDLKLIIYRHSGLLTTENIGEVWAQFLTMPEFTQMKYNLLSDYRKSKFLFVVEEVTEIVNFMRNIEAIVRGKKQALILDDPRSTAASMLFEQKVYEEVGFYVQVFSTEEVALVWLSF
jgi:AAA+ ATPase superfamily predicted ATPase